MSNLTLVAVLCSFVLGPQCFANEGTTLLMSLLSNHAALERYDVLIYEEHTAYGANGQLTTTLKKYRISNDSRTGRFVYAVSSDTMGESSSEEKLKQKTPNLLCKGFIFSKDGLCYQRSFPNEMNSFNSSSLNGLRRSFDVPDLSAIGFVPFPFSQESGLETAQALEMLCIESKAVAVAENNVEIVRENTIGTKGGKSVSHWQFDSSRLEPIRKLLRV